MNDNEAFHSAISAPMLSQSGKKDSDNFEPLLPAAIEKDIVGNEYLKVFLTALCGERSEAALQLFNKYLSRNPMVFDRMRQIFLTGDDIAPNIEKFLNHDPYGQLFLKELWIPYTALEKPRYKIGANSEGIDIDAIWAVIGIIMHNKEVTPEAAAVIALGYFHRVSTPEGNELLNKLQKAAEKIKT